MKLSDDNPSAILEGWLNAQKRLHSKYGRQQIITDRSSTTPKIKHTAKVRPIELIKELTGNSHTDMAIVYRKLNEVINTVNKLK